MEAAGRSCDACGRTANDTIADRCAGCGAATCLACLAQTDRCPTCRDEHDGAAQHPTTPHEPEGTPDPGASADDPARFARGRQQVMAVAVSLLGSVVLLAVVGAIPIGPTVGQLVVLALLLAQVYRGTAWARWLTAGLAALVGVGNAASAWTQLDGDGVWALNACLAGVYLWCAFILALSRAVDAFLRDQRTARARR